LKPRSSAAVSGGGIQPRPATAGYNVELIIRGPTARLAQRVVNGTLLERKPRRGGRVVDGSGLEIRIRDFGLIWTGLDGSVLLSWIQCRRVLKIRSAVDRIARKCFSWVTFAGYVYLHGVYYDR